MADWAVTSRNGRVTVHGARKVVRGKLRDRLSWTDLDGKQRHTMLSVDPKDDTRAKRMAKDIAEDEARGAAPAELSRADRSELLSAKDALAGTGVTPAVACREYREMLNALRGSKTTPLKVISDWAARNVVPSVSLQVAKDRFVTEQETAGNSQRYISSLETPIRWLGKTCGWDREVSEISEEEVEIAFQSLSVSAVTFNNYRSSLFTFFRWCIEKKIAAVNPAEPVKRRKVRREDKQPIDGYTREEMATILNGVDDSLVPYIVLQAFGCLRAIEVCRVEWGTHIQLDRGIARLPTEVTKTEQTRIVEFQDNVVKWLRKYDRFSGRLYTGKTPELVQDYLWRKVKLEIESTGVTYKRNGLRKACASHLIPMVTHIGAAAEMMGHTVAQMKKNYRELRSKEEAEAYFAVTPKNAAKIAKEAA